MFGSLIPYLQCHGHWKHGGTAIAVAGLGPQIGRHSTLTPPYIMA